MPPRKKSKYEIPAAPANGVMALTKELWQAAVNLRGSVEPADYKRYVFVFRTSYTGSVFSTSVVRVMIQIRQDMAAEEQRARTAWAIR